MARLSIRVLGPFQVHLNGEPVSGFASDKVRALLAYLVLSPDRPHRRETLVGLLWPDFPERSARGSLRNALANLRSVLGEHAGSGDPAGAGHGPAAPHFLHSTHQTIQFNRDSDYWLDAAAFESLISAAPPTSDGLEQAVSLVRGLFLEGFSLADAAAFEEWLLLRREYYGRQVVQALATLASMQEERGAYELALAHARRRVELEPWQEDGQRQLMRLLARGGHRTQALAQYETLCRSLRQELGVEPSDQTNALHEAILEGELAPVPDLRPGRRIPVWNLPSPTTRFFGRKVELSSLQALLADPEARLVTLLGLGGSGKTRLALEVGSRLAESDRQALDEGSPLAFPHGIVFAPLAALESVEGLDAALADALDFRLEGGREHLLEFLRRRRLLIILDNMEQLPAAAGFLAEILRVAPGVKILTTSRERLRMQGEHVLSLGGLPYPSDGLEYQLLRTAKLEPGRHDVSGAFAADYPALQLLAEGVRRVRGDFAADAADLRAMVTICRLVDGLPLALELAASWADALSIDDIGFEMQQSLDFLHVDWPDLPDRQRSIRATFDASWRRLSPAEEILFSSLTVFRGGFQREAALHVAPRVDGVPRLLAALVRKSFLQYDHVRNRHQIHELLRQYGAERLAREPAREASARDLHGTYYTDRLQRWYADLIGPRQQVALTEMEAESENIRAAWSWAVEKAEVDRLDQAMEGLERFYWLSGRFRQAEAAFKAAADAATALSAATDSESAAGADRARCMRVWVRGLTWQSNYQRALGKRDAARRIQRQCLRILEDPALSQSDTRLERGGLIFTMGVTDCMSDYELGRQRFREAYSLYRQLDFQWGMAGALNSWSAMSMFLADLQDAKRRAEEALHISQALGHSSGVSRTLCRLANIAWLEGRGEEAERLVREGVAAALDVGTPAAAAYALLSLGETLETRGKFSEAHAASQQSLELLSELGHRSYITQAHSFLGSTDMHLGRYAEARDHAKTGLALAQEHGPRFCIGLNLLLLGSLDLAESAPGQAHQCFEDSLAAYREVGQQHDVCWAHASLAFASRAQADPLGAQRHLYHAFQIARDLGVVYPLQWALPAAALLLLDQDEKVRAIELYALASRYPLVAKSRWFEEVAGKRIAAATQTLPEEVVTAARERGWARDLDATVQELLTELRS